MDNVIRVKVEVYDLALFLKEYAEEIITTSNSKDYNNSVLHLVICWNKEVKEKTGYGFFFDGESKEDDYNERYWKPPTSVSIKALKNIFGLNKSDNICYIPKKFLGTWFDEFITNFKSKTNNSIIKRRWRTIGKAKISISRYF